MPWLRHDLVWQCLDDVEPGASVLEIGCGLGALGARLAQRFDYVGVESDPVSAATAREHLRSTGSGRVLNARFEELQLSPRFEVVCAFEVLEHLEDDQAVLVAWRSLLNDGGRLVISVPAFQSQFGPWDELAGHYRRYEPSALDGVLRQAGFEEVSLHLYGYPIGYVTQTARNLLARRARKNRGRMAERTATSGRLLQPASSLHGAVTRTIAAPFRILQRVAPAQRFGTGIVASARIRG